MKEKKITRMLWHEFSDEELRQKGLDLSVAIREYNETEERKRDMNADFAELLKDIRTVVNALSKAIEKRGEESPVECLVRYHVPKVSEKEIVRLDSGELIAQEAMSPEECQEHLFDRPQAEGASAGS